MSAWGAMAVYVIAIVAFYYIARRQSPLVRMRTPVALGLAAFAAFVLVICALHEIRSFGIALVFACLVVSAASDLATGLIFDAVILAAACGIVLSCFVEANVPATALGLCACVAPLLTLYAITWGRGIGLGDVKLGGIIGAGVGGVEALGAVGAAFVAGALCCIPLVFAGRLRRGDRLPFAPFMAFGTIALVAARVVHGRG